MMKTTKIHNICRGRLNTEQKRKRDTTQSSLFSKCNMTNTVKVQKIECSNVEE